MIGSQQPVKVFGAIFGYKHSDNIVHTMQQLDDSSTEQQLDVDCDRAKDTGQQLDVDCDGAKDTEQQLDDDNGAKDTQQQLDDNNGAKDTEQQLEDNGAEDTEQQLDDNNDNVAEDTEQQLDDDYIELMAEDNDNLGNSPEPADTRGKPWSDDEHRSFLDGVDKLGKGNWKEIATKYVRTRNPTQIASHAQKYYKRLEANRLKRRRTSVFDIEHPRSVHSKTDSISTNALMTNSKELHQQPRLLSSTKPLRLVQAVCLIPVDANGKILSETVLHETNFDSTNFDSNLKAVLRGTDCDTNLKDGTDCD